MYLSQIVKCICLKLPNVFVLYWRMYLYTLYFSQTEKCICSKWQNVFVPNCKMYLSQIDKFVCLKLQISFVANRQIALHWVWVEFSLFNIVYIWYLSKLVHDHWSVLLAQLWTAFQSCSTYTTYLQFGEQINLLYWRRLNNDSDEPILQKGRQWLCEANKIRELKIWKLSALLSPHSRDSQLQLRIYC